ncbi:hypothetical protein [Psychroflexus halocasei]|uniref:Addiction module component n=1 Tax=Psychroflexus halocasei TaxID=908615 RepID=A0A1H4DI59_9FLAO|nr:hypothetical protein [Psychroflexus halocasei]SEA72445.1 hypothetical protein SAMN05421540_11152 [Psychroflexus halocasei]
MNIEARKIEFIQEFLELQSEEAISKLEEILKKEKSSHKETEQMSVQELNKRIDKSMKDSENGRLTEAKDLLADIEKWS